MGIVTSCPTASVPDATAVTVSVVVVIDPVISQVITVGNGIQPPIITVGGVENLALPATTVNAVIAPPDIVATAVVVVPAVPSMKTVGADV